MNLNLNSILLVIYIFLASLGAVYLVFRIFYSGPIKISERGTRRYILTIILIVILAIILTIFLVLNYNNFLNINIFNT